MHIRSWAAARRPLPLLATLLLVVVACREQATAPLGPPYIAILSRFTTPPGLPVSGPFRFVVNELSGTLDISDTLHARAGDTLVHSVPPASYIVEMHDLPPTCQVRDGPRRFVALLDTDNTGIARFTVTCRPSLSIEVYMDGHDLDEQIVYRVIGPSGQKVGYVDLGGASDMNTRADTILLDGLPGGTYEVSLNHVAPNCLFVGQGPASRSVDIPDAGAATLTFRLRCSEEAKRPRILSFASTYHDATSAFVLRVVDPDRDVTSYSWDLTDCRGTSLLPDKLARVRRGLDADRTRLADTLVIIGAFEAGIPDADLRNRCTAIRVEDFRGNSSALVEQPIAAYRGSRAPPEALTFNARLSGIERATITLTAADPDGDFAGTFAAVRTRDGVLGAPDGEPDIGILLPAGFLDTNIPPITFSSRIKWDDVYAVIVYLVDLAGNFARLEDGLLTQ